MKKACVVVPEYQRNNVIFDSNSEFNRDNTFDKYIELKKELSYYNYELSTSDINSIEDSEIIFYFNMPKVLPTENKIGNSYLILRESELIIPDNYDRNKHLYFNKVFTWHDGLIDNQKYFKLNFAHLFPSSINSGISHKVKMVTLIAGNKKVNHTLELYSKRIEAIRWFEKYHPECFDLYGVGWNEYKFDGPKVIRALNRVKYLPKITAKLLNQFYPSYRGMVDNKKKTMENYKFAICYENAKDIPGYITEKIFDCFFAGCIPIYWGANNILDYVPKTCFIDKRDFESYEKLYEYINNMSNEEYTEYIKNIRTYLKSEGALQFKGVESARKISSVLFEKEND
jgi:alpha(1,3/1,4) fucosyltransferase